MVRVPSGYVRSLGGREEEFDARGRLSRTSDANGSAAFVTRDAEGRIQRVTDDRGRWIELQFDGNYVIRASSSTGASAIYRYQGALLVWARGSNGIPFWYGYSTDDRHNLVSIRNDHGLEQSIGYDSEKVRFVSDAKGTVKVFEFGHPATDEYWTAVQTLEADGKVRSTARYHFYEQAAKNGETRMRRKVATVDGEEIDIAYDDEGRPTRIVRGGQEATLRYDDQGRVVEKVEPSGRTRLGYASGTVAVSSARKWKPGAPLEAAPDVHLECKYDAHGNTSVLRDLSGLTAERILHLDRDRRGRVMGATFREGDGAEYQLRFTRGDDDEIETAEVVGVGTLDVRAGAEDPSEKTLQKARERFLDLESIIQSWTLMTSPLPATR